MAWANPEKYDGLILTLPVIKLLNDNPIKFASLCNGVGSEVNWLPFLGVVGAVICKILYHLTPNTILGLNITPASDIHDVSYNIPDHFKSIQDAIKYKKQVDYDIYLNIEILIHRANSWKWLEILRLNRAKFYYLCLRKIGTRSFLEGKVISSTSTWSE